MEWWQTAFAVLLGISLISGLYRYVDKMREGLVTQIENQTKWIEQIRDRHDKEIERLENEIERLEKAIHAVKLK